MIGEVKVGDIVWTIYDEHPTPFFVLNVCSPTETCPREILLSDKRGSDACIQRTRFDKNLYHSFNELLLDIWEPKAYSSESDQDLKDAVSHAYNSGVGKPAQPDRDFEMLLGMLCHPRNVKHFQSDPDILRLAHDVMRRFRKNYPDHSSFFDECDPSVVDKRKQTTFAEAMDNATKAMKNLSDALGGDPCGEIQLEFTPPDSDTNKFVEALKPNGLAQRDCPDEATECFQCNLINLSPLSSDVIKKWATGACVCKHVITFHNATPEQTAKANEAFDKEQEEMKVMREAAEGDSFTITPYLKCKPEDLELNRNILSKYDDETESQCDEVPSCDEQSQDVEPRSPDCQESFLTEEEEANFPSEPFLTNEEAKKMWDEAGEPVEDDSFVANPTKHQTERNDPICRRCDSIAGRMIQSHAMYLQWLNGDCICDQLQPLDKEELETESRCDCGGPDGHLPGGSHCRKPL